MKNTFLSANRFYACFLFILLFLLACNPFPKKDTHPEVPLLEDVLKDAGKFKQVVDMKHVAEVAFLKDDRILLKPDQSDLPFKIVDLDGKVIIEQVFDWKLPFYLDKNGDLYFNRRKYSYPDYKKYVEFKTVVFKDSLDRKSEDLGSTYPDSIKFKMLDDYEQKLLQPYGLKPCGYQILHRERCDVFEIRNNMLLVRQDELYKNDFAKIPKELDKFDEDILIRWQNGKMAFPVYLVYYHIDGYKFKCEDMGLPRWIMLKGDKYLFSYVHGVFLIK